MDIGRLPVVEQPSTCILLKLPLDVWECIYDQVFGGRLITLQVVGSQCQKHCVVRSQCYLPVDDLVHGPIRGILPVPQISIAFLCSCRQVYTEALPILHRRNTFHIWTSQLDVVVHSGLGEYCLPDIRSVYIYHPNNVRPPSDLRWGTVFSILQQMNLERAAFEFAVEPCLVELDPCIGDSGGHSALGLRNLHRLELWFNHRPITVLPSLDKEDLVEKFRKLVLFPGAERNLIFIEHEYL
jgi:hypothetical protein